MQQINIIMIEDDSELAYLLSTFLSKYNIKVTNYEDPYIGLSALNIEKYDFLILDLSLPGMDGLEICKEVRENSDIPIIISSARGDLEDKIIGLELGADDYLPKPYEPKELYARIMSVLRRYNKPSSNKQKNSVFSIDKDAQTIMFNSKPLSLTMAEYEIFSYMIERKNCVLSRAELINNSTSLNN